MQRRSVALGVVTAWFAFAVHDASVAASIDVKPPQKIQDAVDFALSNADPVDAIFVQPGTYDESVVIDFGASGQQSLSLVRTKFPRPAITGGVLVKDARLVTLLGFQIDSPHGDGLPALQIQGSQAVTVAHCVGVPGDDGGVLATGSVQVTVEGGQWDNMLKSGGGSGDGVRIIGGCGHAVRGVVTKLNKGVGVRIEAPLSLVKKVKATANVEGGVVLDGLNNAAKSVVAKENGGPGLLVLGVCEVTKGTFSENGDAGVRLGDGGVETSSGGRVAGSKMSGNGGPGLHVRADQDGVEIEGNTLTGNDGPGIKLHSRANRLHDNVCKGSDGGGHGILVMVGSASNCLTENTVSANEGEGIRVEGDDNLLVGNRAKGDDGIVSSAGATGNQGHANETASGENDFP